MEHVKKSIFRQIYDSLPVDRPIAPKTAWVNEIAELVKVHPTTVRCWLAGTQKPDAWKSHTNLTHPVKVF